MMGTKKKINKAFICIGNNRIRIADITQYGIAVGEKYFVKVKVCIPTFCGKRYEWKGQWEEISQELYDSIREQISRDGFSRCQSFVVNYNGEIERHKGDYVTSSDLKSLRDKYLYIKTETELGINNWRFYADEVSFDIEEKIKELDQILNEKE